MFFSDFKTANKPTKGDKNTDVTNTPAKLILLPTAKKVTRTESIKYVIINGVIIFLVLNCHTTNHKHLKY